MTPELLNEAFSAKSKQFIQSKRCKEFYNNTLETSKRGTCKRGNRHTHLHTEQQPYPLRMRRGLKTGPIQV
jgi:hypothetical protein